VSSVLSCHLDEAAAVNILHKGFGDMLSGVSSAAACAKLTRVFRLECWLDDPDGNRYVAELRLVAVDRARRNWHAPGSGINPPLPGRVS
jgi:hypothetical protein